MTVHVHHHCHARPHNRATAFQPAKFERPSGSNAFHARTLHRPCSTLGRLVVGPPSAGRTAATVPACRARMVPAHHLRMPMVARNSIKRSLRSKPLSDSNTSTRLTPSTSSGPGTNRLVWGPASG